MPLFTTLRQGRQFWGGWLLGVLLALLPLRGWAELAMHLPAPAPQSIAVEASVPPCHAAMAADEGAVPGDAASACSLCSLCHGSALVPFECGIVTVATSSPIPALVPEGHRQPTLPLPERPPRA